MLRTLLISTLALFSSLALASDISSPVGTWQTVNEDSHQPSSLVRITQENGALQGHIEKLLSGSHFKPGDVCKDCPAPFKNQAIVGLGFLWGFVPDQANTWKDGHVLDPRSGHIYKGTMRLVAQGQKLELRGYWGPFFRTQTWTRAN